MRFIPRKLEIKYLIYKNKMNNARPEYSRKEWFFKIFMLGLSGLTYQFLGLKINDLELNLYYGKILAYGLDYVFLLGCQGIVLALALWRLLEIYWYGKNKVKDLAGS